MPANKTTTPAIAVFGEILWDLLPQGAVPGGAPMNVTYHLQQLGHPAAFITRLGNDENGQGLTAFLHSAGIDLDNVQTDDEYPTGTVPVSINAAGEIHYEIVKPVAWDFIQTANENIHLVEDAAFFVFGTLAARSCVSSNSLFQLLERANTKVLDINLRPPHYDKNLVSELLGKADIIKMNLAELELISGWLTTLNTIEDRMAFLLDRFNINTLIVTLGADGAVLHRDGQSFRHPGFKVQLADTVGSGDAFLAAIISQFIQNKSSPEALEFASALGALVASKTGGCPEYCRLDIEKIIHTGHLASRSIDTSTLH